MLWVLKFGSLSSKHIRENPIPQLSKGSLFAC
jgi:hypothetical protein